MNLGFWERQKKGFLVMAPMEGVTDTVFRRAIMQLGRPEVFYTEFTNVHGICSEGFEKVAERLKYYPVEKPIVAQIWGTEPEKFYQGSKVVAEMGFDGIDINFGCPVKDVVKIGACAAMISTDSGIRTRVREIIQAAKEGAGNVPVSVKTRVGNKQVMTEDWIGFLLDQELAEITVHLRTAAEKSGGSARWEEMEKIMSIVRKNNYLTRVVGNGDVLSRTEAERLCEEYGIDGVMIGRGVFQNPAVFGQEGQLTTIAQRKLALTTHSWMWVSEWGDGKPFAEFKKVIKMYISGFDGAAEMRSVLMQAENFDQLAVMLTFDKFEM